MANRFTDTEQWEDPWFRSLSADMKTAWNYLCDRCDHAGIWKIDMELMNYFITPSKPITLEDLTTTMNNGKKRLVQCGQDHLFIESFIDFQYKCGINVNNNAHRGVIKQLVKHKMTQVLPKSCLRAIKGLTSPKLGAEEPLGRGPGNGIGNTLVDTKHIETANKIIDYFNKTVGTSYKHSPTSREHIIARLNDGFTGDDCAKVIHKKWSQWKDDDKMCKFIRIETLFRPTKFEGYLNELAPEEPKRKML